MAINIGGTATLVGDPPNLIIASRAGLTFNDILVHLAPLLIVLTAVFIGLCRVLFRSAFRPFPSAPESCWPSHPRDRVPRPLA